MGSLLEELLNRVPAPEPEPEPGTEEPAPEPEPEPEPEPVPAWVGTFPWSGEIFDADISTQGAQTEQRQIANIAEGLQILLERVETISKILGIDEYPIPASESFLEEQGQAIGQIEVENAAAFQAWQIERFDELIGQWEIAIQVADSDPNEPGDQPKLIQLKNVAEAMAETFGLAMQASINSEILINLSARNLAETGQVKQQGFRTYKLLEALKDWSGVELEEKIFEVPYTFTPGAERFDDLVKESKQQVSGHTYQEKSNPGGTLKDNLHDLLHGAAVVRTAFWRKLEPAADLAAQIVQRIKGYEATSDEINPEDEDFDRFLEDVELGWTNQVGATDTQKPYGRPYNRRPKIRQLGVTSETEGGSSGDTTSS
jgi:hypothetical protein